MAGAVTPNKGTFKGTTSQKNPDTGAPLGVEVKVGKAGKAGRKVKSFRMQFSAACPDGSQYNSAFFAVPAGKLGKKAKFSFEIVYRNPPDLSPGETADITVDGSGKFTKKKKAKGTVSLQANIFPPGSQTALKCVTGQVSWTAKR